MNRRGQFVILAFAVLVGSYLAIVWRSQSTPHPPKVAASASPTPTLNPTAGWATYTSTDPSLTVKYPAGWAVLRQPIPAIISNQPDITSRAPSTVFLLIDSRPGTTLESCYAQTNYTTSDYSYTQKTVTVSGHQGSRYVIDPKPGSGKTGYATAYLFVHGGRCYNLALASLSASARDGNASLAATIAGTLQYQP